MRGMRRLLAVLAVGFWELKFQEGSMVFS